MKSIVPVILFMFAWLVFMTYPNDIIWWVEYVHDGAFVTELTSSSIS